MSKERIVNLEEADAIGFGCVSKSERYNYEYIPFKMPKLNEDEIRIKILYTGLCQSDVLWSNGSKEEYINIKYPCVPGHEIVGEVISKGKFVYNLELGDIVGFGLFINSCGNCLNCLNEKENICNKINDNLIFSQGFGGWASHFQGKAKFSVKIPKEIPLQICPTLMCMGVSLYKAIKNNVKQSDEVTIIGVGEVSHMAIRICKTFKAKVNVLTSNSENVHHLKDIGADRIIIIQNISTLKDMDVVISCITEGPIGDYIKLLKKGGKFISILPIVSEVKIDLYYVVLNEIKIEGAFIGNIQDLKDSLEYFAKYKIFPNIELFTFDEFPKALHRIHYEKPNQRFVVKCLSQNFPQFN